MEILNDFSTSVRKAFDEIDPNWKSYDGLVICGSWPGENEEKMLFDCIKKLKEAEKKNIPVLGICFGLQVIGIERGWKLKKLPERRIGIKLTKGWWGETYESYWHDYIIEDENGQEVNLIRSTGGYVIGTQFHPEYQSSPEKPHPVLKEFLNICKSV